MLNWLELRFSADGVSIAGGEHPARHNMRKGCLTPVSGIDADGRRACESSIKKGSIEPFSPVRVLSQVAVHRFHIEALGRGAQGLEISLPAGTSLKAKASAQVTTT
jgi:hypothetical protein